MFRLEKNDDHARLVLHRPEARNAIPAAAWPELAEKLAVVAGSDVRLLVVTGAGNSFCAGADLGDFAAMRGDEAAAARFRQDMRTALDALRALAIPTLAVVEGHCYGAGVALAMACDIRLAGNVSEFAITPAKIGITFPQEDVHRLVSLVGPGHAARMLLTAGKVCGSEALHIGLADHYAVSADTVIDAIVANDPESLKLLKQGIALASAGVRSDPAMDARFDALIAGEAVAQRLEALRRK
jgi:enoyl-CoA hydratase/carnithine racemase